MSKKAMFLQSLQAQCNVPERVKFYLRTLERVRISIKLKDNETAHSTEHYMLKTFVLDILNGNLTYDEIKQISAICAESFKLPYKRWFA
ncbi:MAG: hypothetical protein H8D45_29070 [Bacteroidetes bacterium]|nr:hypothetical protein [Bacteroidota bacterium]